MINYNPKRWWNVLLSFPRSPVFATLLLDVLAIGLYAGAVVWVENRFDLEAPLGPQILSLLGIILGLLLVFRTNTAYDRWWEGRRFWGQLTNVSRALARQLDAMLPRRGRQSAQRYAELLAAWPHALIQRLRGHGIREPGRLSSESCAGSRPTSGSGALPREALDGAHAHDDGLRRHPGGLRAHPQDADSLFLQQLRQAVRSALRAARALRPRRRIRLRHRHRRDVHLLLDDGTGTAGGRGGGTIRQGPERPAHRRHRHGNRPRRAFDSAPPRPRPDNEKARPATAGRAFLLQRAKSVRRRRGPTHRDALDAGQALHTVLVLRVRGSAPEPQPRPAWSSPGSPQPPPCRHRARPRGPSPQPCPSPPWRSAPWRRTLPCSRWPSSGRQPTRWNRASCTTRSSWPGRRDRCSTPHQPSSNVISAFSAFFSGDAQPVIAATATSATRPFVMTMNSASEVVSRTPPWLRRCKTATSYTRLFRKSIA